jgi:hypothetical protein
MKMRILLTLALLCALPAQAMFFRQYDWEAQRWAQVQIPANSGTISGTAYVAGTRFMQNVKWWGVRPLLGRVNLYLGNETNAMLVPIIRTWFSTSDVVDDLLFFTSADYSEATGLAGNTTSKYLRPNAGFGVGVENFTDINSIHFAVYNRTATNEESICMGMNTTGANQEVKISSFGGTSNVEFTVGTDGVADSNGTGFYCMTRVSSSFRAMYKNGVSIVSSTTCSGSVGTGVPIVHANQSIGLPGNWTSRALSFYAMGFGVSASLVVPYNIAVTKVQLAVGRKV